ncbi:hypothetical protein ACQR1I_01740 [Bradyrhizobium sp. HKCCYLS2038]|uniref:hypothetical protein n=1 Tax=unclassified Bradyrhizobium TaxID=2631580 RepID=UPI003EBF29CA
MSLTSGNSLPSPLLRDGRGEFGRYVGCSEIKVRPMRNLLITAGPAEDSFRVMLPSKDGTSAGDQRARRSRADGRAARRPQQFRWGRPSRAVVVLLRGLRATLAALLPAETESAPDVRVHTSAAGSSARPRLRVVRDCGRALEAPAAPRQVWSGLAEDAITPRHRVWHLRVRDRR